MGTVNVRKALATRSSDKLHWGINSIIAQKDEKIYIPMFSQQLCNCSEGSLGDGSAVF